MSAFAWHPEERESHHERQRGGQPPPWPVQGHGAGLSSPPGAEPRPKSIALVGSSPGETSPEINREGDSSAAWGAIPSTFFPGTFKVGEESSSH